MFGNVRRPRPSLYGYLGQGRVVSNWWIPEAGQKRVIVWQTPLDTGNLYLPQTGVRVALDVPFPYGYDLIPFPVP